MQAITLNYRLAHAAAWDAGNRSMRKAGRTKWNEDDYNACVDEFRRLMPVGDIARELHAGRLLDMRGLSV